MGSFPSTPPWRSTVSFFDSRNGDPARVGCLFKSYFKRHMLNANLYVLMHMQSCCAAYLNFFFDVPIAVTVVNYA